MSRKNSETQPDIDGAFLKTLQTHNGGQVLSELAAAIRDVTGAVGERTKPGEVNLRIIISPEKEGAFGFGCEVKTKLPKKPIYCGLFFADEANNLVRENPNQTPLPGLRTVSPANDEDEAPLKQVAAQ